MPIYEYRCSSCGFQKEYLQKISDPLISVCPECGKSTFAKMLSAAGFQLKGSGWYATDFRNSGSKPAAKSTADGGDKAAAKSTAEGGDKAAAKPDSSAGTSDKKDAGSKPGGNTNSKSEAAA